MAGTSPAMTIKRIRDRETWYYWWSMTPAFAGAGLFRKPVPTPDQVQGLKMRGRGCELIDALVFRLRFGSGGETGDQLYNELGAGKLDGINFQGVPSDEAKSAG